MQVKLPPSEVDALLEASTVVALPDELLQHILKQEWNVLDPRAAVAFSSASHGLWTATQALLPQLKADHEGEREERLDRMSIRLDPGCKTGL